MPAPLIVPWRGRNVRIRHDDPKPEPYAPQAAVIGSAMQLATDARGLELALNATVCDRYSVAVTERPEGVTVALRRRDRAAT